MPEVPTRQETAARLSFMPAMPQPIAKLLYGSGLPASEAMRLRVRDIEAGMKALAVRSGLQNKDRAATFPASVLTS